MLPHSTSPVLPERHVFSHIFNSTLRCHYYYHLNSQCCLVFPSALPVFLLRDFNRECPFFFYCCGLWPSLQVWLLSPACVDLQNLASQTQGIFRYPHSKHLFRCLFIFLDLWFLTALVSGDFPNFPKSSALKKKSAVYILSCISGTLYKKCFFRYQIKWVVGSRQLCYFQTLL